MAFAFAMTAGGCSESVIGPQPELGQIGTPDTILSEIVTNKDVATVQDTQLPDTSTGDISKPDASVDASDVNATDTGAGLGDIGSPCTDGDDCNSGYCVQSADGTVCSKTCDAECPDGWSCKQVLAGGDAVFICLPNFPTLCMPCMANADCQLPGSESNSRCIPFADEGAFCGGDCANTPCPEGYECQETQDILGQDTAQCVKVEGLCECSKLAISKAAMTSCAVTNEFGTCPSERQCTDDGLSACDGQPASAELCDTVDNDCNPETADGAAEETAGIPCDGEDSDLCEEGTLECVDGAIVCTDPGGDNLDVCDGEDNDCDPSTPDGAADAEFDGACESPDDADICQDDFYVCDGGMWTCPDNEGDTLEICDGLDNDCNELTADGSQDPQFNAPCDGDDTDLCADGLFLCKEGSLSCTDSEVSQKDLCDGLDNDCNPETPDGADEPTFGMACDGDDADLCTEGTIVCENGQLVCSDQTDDTQEVCDGQDNDCNPATPDGLQDPQLGDSCDGGDTDLCEGGTLVCVDGGLSCNDSDESEADVCDGKDNDCNPDTPDGFDEPSVGNPCDGEGDEDLCEEGNIVCEGGELTCDDENTDNPDICDGEDNDCDPDTMDGDHDVTVGVACDGDDVDTCTDGVTQCIDAEVTCVDAADPLIELCDGVDNDCDPATVDGSGDPALGEACDGEADADLCAEGTKVCTDGVLVCNDPGDENPDVCDGEDNDCNDQTPDGLHDPQLNAACDGADDDLCEEGKLACEGGELTCDDNEDQDPDVCDGVDNDCNPATDDGSADPGLGLTCDGVDIDLCEEGKQVCTDGALVCDDPNSENPELCDGEDNDCNPVTPDGFSEPTLNDDCDGDDADVCIEGAIICTAGALICEEPADNDDEVCDGQDNDCDGEVDEGFPNTDGTGLADCLDEDDDDDGVTDALDCEPLNAAVFPTCNGKQCGDNGCGESCGSCNGQDACIDNQCVCQPNCNGKQCGPDGCGGSCGSCGGQDVCIGDQCVCQPNCNGKQCGSDGCGGSCGGCGGQDACVNNQCVCQPNCNGKQCGSNGCGGSCGGCGGQSICSNYQCVCQPNCGGKQCGSDGCGGSCGGCGQFQQCQNNQCICPGPHYGWVGGSCRPSCGGLLGLYGQPDSGQGCCGGGGCKGAGWPKGPNGSYDCDWCCAGPPGCN